MNKATETRRLNKEKRLQRAAEREHTINVIKETCLSILNDSAASPADKLRAAELLAKGL